ncbi:MAG: tape measure protein, partial [Oscillospiraceae bacterium]|nr:tape measure protein [Oscillospiraceae bacterium]
MVAKLGTLAPEAFNNNAEVLAFVEQFNNHVNLSGANAQGAQAAMLQLTQAMSSGVLRGEELNSVLEQTPTIANAIADYLGVSIGKMRELASQGDITTNIIKAALFTIANDVNAAVGDIPLTFGDAMNAVKNEGLNALRPFLEELNAFLNSDIGHDALNGFISAVRMGGEALLWLVHLVESGAAFIGENWDMVSTLLIGGAAAGAAVMTASAVQSAGAWVAANWPLLLIVGSIVLVIYMARQMGATWEDIAGTVGGAFGFMYAFAMNNFIVPGYNAFAYLGNFVKNFLKVCLFKCADSYRCSNI